MKEKCCLVFGDAPITPDLEKKLSALLQNMVNQEGVKVFCLPCLTDFDRLAGRILSPFKKEEITVFSVKELIVKTLTEEGQAEDLSLFLPSRSACLRFAVLYSDLVLCHTEEDKGVVHFARQMEKKIIEI